ncbi:hypothetical protein NHJ13734_005030 [Beauveria thailandica]
MVQSTVEDGTMLTQVICRGAPISFLTTSARKNSARTSAIQNPSARIAAPLRITEALECTLGQLAGSSQSLEIPAVLDCVLPLQTRPIDCARRKL